MITKNDKCIPLELVKKISDRYPGCWDYIESMREDRGTDLPNWDDDCYIPIAGTLAITAQGSKDLQSLLNGSTVLDAGLMAALAPWRIYKQIFEFAYETEELLLNQAEDCRVPIETLQNLPYPCIYIRTRTIHRLDGFFAHIEHDAKDGRKELRLTVIKDNGECYPLIIHLVPNGTILDGIRGAKAESTRVSKSLGDVIARRFEKEGERLEDLILLAAPLVQLVLYVCAQNKEVELDPNQEKIYRAPKEKRFIRDKYSEIRKYNCGEEIAQQIRRSYRQGQVNYTYLKDAGASGSGTPKRPHVRRGHWHHYWTGKADDKKIILKWQPPTFIHGDETESKDIDINKVEDDKQDE